jgi:hypothetical protein
MEKLLEKYKQAFENAGLKKERLVFDKNWKGIEKRTIKWIVVGDNPGVEEVNNKEYFSENGHTGKRIREYFKTNFEINKENILFLNKVPIHTAKTAQLAAFENLQIFVNQIFALLNGLVELNTKPEFNILIMGYGKNKLNKSFYKNLPENFYSNKRIFFTPHFSNSAYRKVEMKFIVKGDTGIDILKRVSDYTKGALNKNFNIKFL